MKGKYFTMKRQVLVFSISILFLSLATCAVLFQVGVYGCLLWECAPQRSFKALDLDLPAHFFPREATVNSLRPLSDGEGTTDNGVKSIYWAPGSGGALYIIFRLPSARQAHEMFQTNKEVYADSESKEPWQRPAALTFTSPKADEFFVGCGVWHEYRCGMIARYAEYVVEFNATIDRAMTHENFEKIVKFIDNQISGHLYP